MTARFSVGCPDAVLLDAYDPAAFGGTGKVVDWNIVREQVRPTGLACQSVFAGGLTAERRGCHSNAQPDGVDVASGVEASPGKKDPQKVREFIERAKQAFSSQGLGATPPDATRLVPARRYALAGRAAAHCSGSLAIAQLSSSVHTSRVSPHRNSPPARGADGSRARVSMLPIRCELLKLVLSSSGSCSRKMAAMSQNRSVPVCERRAGEASIGGSVLMGKRSF